jgi:hypothetical protein
MFRQTPGAGRNVRCANGLRQWRKIRGIEDAIPRMEPPRRTACFSRYILLVRDVRQGFQLFAGSCRRYGNSAKTKKISGRVAGGRTLSPMTHAGTFTLEDGWAAARQMLAQIAAPFGVLPTAPLARDVYEELLQWLRPAEHLARLVLHIIAHALTPVVRAVRKVARRAKFARRIGFRFALRASQRGSRRRTARVAGLYLWRRPLPPQEINTDAWPKGVLEEIRAPLKRPPPPPALPPTALRLEMPAGPLAARMAALARVLANPHAAAKRIAARRRDADAVARLLSSKRIFTRTPCLGALLRVHDREFAPPPPDSR